MMEFDEVLEHYDPALGLEVHVELNTTTKMFCGCPNEFGAEPNTHTCPVCLGLPGALPSINAKAVESAIRLGLALHCDIAPYSRMARKNYFYPDMTKNFQTSQYDEPICHDGYVDVEVEGEQFRVEIERAHLEEDAGKSTHAGHTGRLQGSEYSLLDYNRAGVPLIEIVTRPVVGAGARTPQVARAYVAHLRELVKALDISDARMEQGSLRCDANVSVAPRGAEVLGTRTETKNVNSLRSIERAVTHEICRQAAVLDAGDTVVQETRHFDESSGTTSPGRPKSDADDYRYFAEPDLLPIAASAEWIEQLRQTLPEPPNERRARLQSEWGFSDIDFAGVVGAGALDLVDATVRAGASPAHARKWWVSELARRANEAGVELDEVGITPEQVAEVQRLVDEGVVTDKLARQVIDGVVAGEGEPRKVVESRGLVVVSDEGALGAAVDEVIAANPDVAEKIRGGKVKAAGALIGQVMKAMRGQADAAKVRELIMQRLG
ncbi:Asp-tRNA(Asn)/Glu-tRNA(Gln) amidotransferase subunit GatB [uncultured Tessaracoccus sp.]|uniref:Asp-tRNA(Asn)/Glu-tRNA(Gln) amidotransferase subunit GatB n=1 Tax=uncultured Tessaracoccus sp. TaxID=905023 RepID=UPI0025FB5766|nr:Asp-tRNA(Asn)/Glu-tRNA(Gln) amidotransferase subunit GatB [uncultured Tessaracoccus sp.]